jgi:hypothetical protein
MIRVNSLVQIAALLGLMIAPTLSYATTWASGRGSMCQPDYSVDYTSYLDGMVRSNSTVNGVWVNCPVAATVTAWPESISNVVVGYKDGNTNGDVNCQVMRVVWDGTTYFSNTKGSCSTGGGCTTYALSYTGSSHLQWTSSDLGSNLNVLYPDGSYSIGCYIANVQGFAWSGIVYYYVAY